MEPKKPQPTEEDRGNISRWSGFGAPKSKEKPAAVAQGKSKLEKEPEEQPTVGSRWAESLDRVRSFDKVSKGVELASEDKWTGARATEPESFLEKLQHWFRPERKTKKSVKLSTEEFEKKANVEEEFGSEPQKPETDEQEPQRPEIG